MGGVTWNRSSHILWCEATRQVRSEEISSVFASCHTLGGYRPLKSLLAGRDRANIGSFITMLHEYKADSPYRKFMPPMVGTRQDVDDLSGYLNDQVNPPQKPIQTAQK